MFKAVPLTEKTTDAHQGLPLEPILACVELGLDRTASSVLQDTHHAQNVPRSISENRVAQIQRMEREKLAKEFFDWLRSKVKRIVKLVVSDSVSMPCRDSVIRSCLLGFDVRYLDWNKADLCIRSLCIPEIAPNLRELWLTWSGRNSTLLGWANKKGGLGQFDKVSGPPEFLCQI